MTLLLVSLACAACVLLLRDVVIYFRLSRVTIQFPHPRMLDASHSAQRFMRLVSDSSTYERLDYVFNMAKEALQHCELALTENNELLGFVNMIENTHGLLFLKHPQAHTINAYRLQADAEIDVCKKNIPVIRLLSSMSSVNEPDVFLKTKIAISTGLAHAYIQAWRLKEDIKERKNDS